MPILFIPVAVSGAGKSAMADALGVPRVSTDAIRKVLTGDENSQDRNGEVFKMFYESIDLWLRGDRSVYADATNLLPAARVALRHIASKINEEASGEQDITRGYPLYPVQTHLILFRNLGQAIARNQARDRVVPSDVMIRQIEQYERAVLDIEHETYDFITEVSATR